MKIKFLVDADRHAGHGTQPTPPKEIIGLHFTPTRALINNHAYWIEHNGEKYVVYHAETDGGGCVCIDCREVRHLQSKGVLVK
jgi:hypothetical protein